MRVFVTGASGFVGSAIVQELLQNGHEVLGLVRSEAAVERLRQLGAASYLGDVNNPIALRKGAQQCDAIIHTAFNHDFSKYKASCEADRLVIRILGETLLGTDKPLVITSGIGLLRSDDQPIKETDSVPASSDITPRAASEEAAQALSAEGIDVYTVRLPPSVHGEGDRGFIPLIMSIAREKGESAYVAEGNNRWPATHRIDVAVLYRLIVEKRPELKVLHAVAETGIPFRRIAELIGKGLDLPVVSKTGEDVAAHFGWFAHFAALDCAASSAETQAVLSWDAKATDLLTDIVTAGYLAS